MMQTSNKIIVEKAFFVFKKNVLREEPKKKNTNLAAVLFSTHSLLEFSIRYSSTYTGISKFFYGTDNTFNLLNFLSCTRMLWQSESEKSVGDWMNGMNSENTNLMKTVGKTLKKETCLDRNVRIESWSKLISMFLERWEKVEATVVAYRICVTSQRQTFRTKELFLKCHMKRDSI